MGTLNYPDIKNNRYRQCKTSVHRLKNCFPNAVFKPIRGNIGTRLEKVKNGEYDAVIMARAAINRLAVSDVKIENLGDNFICAAGQGNSCH